MVRSFAEMPNRHFLQHHRGARLTAHKLTAMDTTLTRTAEQVRAIPRRISKLESELAALRTTVAQLQAQQEELNTDLRERVMFCEARMQSLADRLQDEDQDDLDEAAQAAWDPSNEDDEAEPMEEASQPLQQTGPHGDDSRSVSNRPAAAEAPVTFTQEQVNAAVRAALLATNQANAEPAAPSAKRRRTDEGAAVAADTTFATMAGKLHNRIKLYVGDGGGLNYPDWEDHFVNVALAFELPEMYWTRLATTYLYGSAM